MRLRILVHPLSTSRPACTLLRQACHKMGRTTCTGLRRMTERGGPARRRVSPRTTGQGRVEEISVSRKPTNVLTKAARRSRGTAVQCRTHLRRLEALTDTRHLGKDIYGRQLFLLLFSVGKVLVIGRSWRLWSIQHGLDRTQQPTHHSPVVLRLRVCLLLGRFGDEPCGISDVQARIKSKVRLTRVLRPR